MIVLQTPRLTLRWYRADDAPSLLALVNDPGWLQHIGQRHVHTLDDARRFIEERLVAAYVRQGFGLWAMERRDSGGVAGEVVGMCGLVRRDGLPGIDLGYALLPAHRGAGLVHEAATACLDHAHRVLGQTRVLAITSPDNHASARVLSKLGFAPQGRVTLPGEAVASDLYAWQAASESSAL